jgi:GNAT superfamily N-acetyltransferase
MAEAEDVLWNEVAHQALVDGFVAPALYQADAKVVMADGLVLAQGRVPHRWWRTAFQVKPRLSGAEAMNRIEEFFGDEEYAVYARTGIDTDLDSAARERGLTTDGRKEPYMLTESPPHPFDIPEWLTIDSTPSEKLLVDFAEVAGAVFGKNEHDYAAVRDIMRPDEAFTPFCEYFVAYVDGQPVATSAYWNARRIPCIYWVAVLPEFRKRGICEAIVKTTCVAAFARGTKAVTLQASAEGHPQYLRYGFRDVGSFTKFERLNG